MFGPHALEPHTSSLDELIKKGLGPSRKEGETLLRQLRGQRCFSTMLKVAKSLNNDLSAMGRLYEVQALIDQNKLANVYDKLNSVLNDLGTGGLNVDLPSDPGECRGAQLKLRSETLGLLGRFYKQRFVTAHGCGNMSEAAQHLRDSMYYHQEAYKLDAIWHGSNLAALAWRAGVEGIDLGRLPTANQIGKRLKSEIQANGSPESFGPWEISALAQAHMAQGDWDKGLALYQRYIRQLHVDRGEDATFVLMGDLRQLQEIWLIDRDGEGPRAAILHELSRCILTNRDGSVSLSFDALRILANDDTVIPTVRTSKLEAILDDDRNMFPHSVIQNLLPQVDSICRVRGRVQSGKEQLGGTGFLVYGEAIGVPYRQAVLVTAAHVLASQDPYDANTLLAHETELAFESWQGSQSTRTFSVSTCLWQSNPPAYDVSVWQVNDLPDNVPMALVYPMANPFPRPNPDLKQRIGTLVPIGHPGGRSLTWSMGSNPILDHDLHRDQSSPRIVHYKADTEPGSSGCPVFDRSGKVVAIHRACSELPISDTPKPYKKDYIANEGIGIHSAARACRQHSNRKILK